VDPTPETPPPRPVKPVILSYASVLARNEITVEVDGDTVRYQFPPRSVWPDLALTATMVLLLLPIFLTIAFGTLGSWVSWVSGVLFTFAILGIAGRAVYSSIRAAKAHRTIQADKRGIMVSYVADKGPAFRDIDRAEIRNVWVRKPFLDRTWCLLVFTRGFNYAMEFTSPSCPVVLEMQKNLRDAMKLPQDERSVPFHILTTPLDK
jgi:hypothetical protein